MTCVLNRSFGKLSKLIGFPVEYAQDMWQYFRHNGHSPMAPQNERLFYHAVIQTHTIEKGLALEKPRPLFGREKIRSVLQMLRRYDASLSAFPVEMAHGAIDDYRKFNLAGGHQDPILTDIEVALSSSSVTRTGGVKALAQDATWTDAPTAAAFLTSRTSCRMFSPEPLDLTLINEAVRQAQSAPSQCNRQATKAHFFQDPKQIAELLSLQGGSAGFSDSVGNLFVITSDVMAWGGPQQRNQLYVDGGLFAMTLLLACHGLALATCPLNLAVTNRIERRVKAAASIANNERVIVMIAVGKPIVQGRKAAKSPRRQVEEILTHHEAREHRVEA